MVNLGRALPGDSPDEGLGDFASPECCKPCVDAKGIMAAYGCYTSSGDLCDEVQVATVKE